MFYKSSCIICRYALNTVVHYPHDKKVVDLKFCPHGDDLDVVHSVVTSSVDGKFKTWTLVDDTDIYSELKPVIVYSFTCRVQLLVCLEILCLYNIQYSK